MHPRSSVYEDMYEDMYGDMYQDMYARCRNSLGTVLITRDDFPQGFSPGGQTSSH